jgi:hypothetical protein
MSKDFDGLARSDPLRDVKSAEDLAQKFVEDLERSMEEGPELRTLNRSKKYYLEVSNLIDDLGLELDEVRLHLHYCRRVGPIPNELADGQDARNGYCWEAVKTTIAQCKFRKPARYYKARRELERRGLIRVTFWVKGQNGRLSDEPWTQGMSNFIKRVKVEVLDTMDVSAAYYDAVAAYNHHRSTEKPPEIDGWTIPMLREWVQGRSAAESSQNGVSSNGRVSLVPPGNEAVGPIGNQSLVPIGNTKNNKTQEQPSEEQPQVSDCVLPLSYDQVMARMVDREIGMRPNAATQLLDGYGVERCSKQLAYLPYRLRDAESRGKPVKNPAGWLRRSIEEDWSPPR